MPFHPEIASRLPLLNGIPSIAQALEDPELLARLHAFDAYPDATQPPQVATDEVNIPGPHGPVPVRIYWPDDEPSARRTGFVWVHGGAFKFGDLDMNEADWTARELAARAGAVVVSVDYRLAVDGITYPIPLDDVVAAVHWVRNNLEYLGIRSVSLGGASAGGHLAASAALRLRDEDDWLPEHLILVYPNVHFDLPAPSKSLQAARAELPPCLKIPPEFHRSTRENYLGDTGPQDSPYAMPGGADLTGLGPTLVLNAEYDDLRASGEAFSASLAAAGVDIKQIMVRGVLHGFLNLSKDFAPVNEALTLMARRLRSDNRC